MHLIKCTHYSFCSRCLCVWNQFFGHLSECFMRHLILKGSLLCPLKNASKLIDSTSTVINNTNKAFFFYNLYMMKIRSFKLHFDFVVWVCIIKFKSSGVDLNTYICLKWFYMNSAEILNKILDFVILSPSLLFLFPHSFEEREREERKAGREGSQGSEIRFKISADLLPILYKLSLFLWKKILWLTFIVVWKMNHQMRLSNSKWEWVNSQCGTGDYILTLEFNKYANSS